MTEYPFVSVIIPCRNELKYIRTCLDSILANDYPTDRLEILVVDGMSEDGTRDILHAYAARYPFLRMIDNPKKIMPSGTNFGIRAAQGTVIMIAGAHAQYPRDYISKCVRSLQSSGADNVGGVRRTEPKADNFTGKSIAYLLSHPLGTGAPKYLRGARSAQWVDTVWGGCYRREVFERVGLYNEALVKSQDREFNQRLRDAGGKILLVPEIECRYQARSNPVEFFQWVFQAGAWPFWGSKLSRRRIFSLRNFVPMLFVITLLLLLAASVAVPAVLRLLIAVTTVYGTAGVVSAVPLARRERDARYLLALPLLFAATHFIYGVGSIYGILRAAPAVSPNTQKPLTAQ